MYLNIKGERNLIETSLIGGKSNLLFFFFSNGRAVKI